MKKKKTYFAICFQEIEQQDVIYITRSCNVF